MEQERSIPQTDKAGQDKRGKRQRRNRFFTGVAWLLLLAVALPAASLGWLAVRTGRALQRQPRPQAVFVLGGRSARYRHALALAAERPDVEIVVSSAISDGIGRRLADQAGIGIERITIDHRAVDTLTNYTCMIDLLEARGYRHVYLLTSDYHMRRSCVLAHIILGARGIAFTPVPTPSNTPHESRLRAARDAVRAVLWLVSGWDEQYLPFMTPRSIE